MGRIKAPRIPPVYEFRVTDIIWYYFFTGCFSTLITLIFSSVFQSLKPVLILFVLQVFLVIWLMYKFKSAQEENIPSKYYHPNLLPQDEYLALKRQYDEACAVLNRFYLYMSENDRKALFQSHYDIIDNVSPILNVQNELRALCLFKMEFGIVETPVVYGGLEEESDYEEDFEDDSVEKMDENASVKTPSPADVNNVLTPENKLHAPQLNEISNIENKGNVQSNAPKTIDKKKQKVVDDWFPVRDYNYKKEFESDNVMDKNTNYVPYKAAEQNDILASRQSPEISIAHYENAQSSASKNTFPIEKSDMEKIMKKLEILEQLEIQFVEIKVENETLKESIEKILESQIVF